MANLKFIAQGGFNSGRLYSAEGQRIFWAQREDGWLYFIDIDRCISGWVERRIYGFEPGAIPLDELVEPVGEHWLMARYDLNEYQYYPAGIAPNERPPSPPDGFDFGPSLRIR